MLIKTQKHIDVLYINEELLFTYPSKSDNNMQLDGTPVCNHSWHIIQVLGVHCVQVQVLCMCSAAVSPLLIHMVNGRCYLPTTGKAIGCMCW